MSGNAAAVIDFAAAAGRKFPYERIGYLADRAVLLARGVVDGLDTAPRGNVVFGGREFQQGIVSQRTGRLHEALSEALLSDQYGPVEILERAGDDLGRRSRITVDQHGQRQVRQDRVVRGTEYFLLRSDPSLGADHLRTFGNEHRNDLDGFLQNAASVAPVVEDQSPQGILCAEFLDRGAHLFVRSFGEVAVLDISDPFCDEPGVGDAGNGYPFARVRVSCPPPINRSMTIRTVVLGVPFRAELICAGSQPLVSSPSIERILSPMRMPARSAGEPS
jgi:hypothetical protein